MTTKSTTKSRSIEERLLSAQVAINNALDDADIQSELSQLGYTAAKIQAGKTLLDEAQALVNQQKVEYGEQYQATEVVRLAWDAANKAYTRTLKVARVAFKGNPKAENALQLAGKRKQSLSGWLQQALAFYDNLLKYADLRAELANFGYTQAKLEAEQAMVGVVFETNQLQEAEKGDAQEATKLQDAKLDALDDWLSDFKAIAEAALEDTPQRLEKLGFGSIA